MGLRGQIQSKVSSLIDGVSPFTQTKSVDISGFLDERTISGEKWNKVYPYVFRIGGGKSNIADSLKTSLKNLLPTQKGNDSYVVLPIAPQNISVSTPAAINVTVTLNGILEEHNGAPLRNIRIQGTTGVTPFRGMQYGINRGPQNLIGDLFRNTINAGYALSDTIRNNKTDDDLSDSNLLSGGGSPGQEYDSTGGIYATGYWHFHKLVKFMDKYLNDKKKRENAAKYLVFEMQKDDLYYKCALKNFAWEKAPGTQEYKYTVDLVGWAYTVSEPQNTLSQFFPLKREASVLLRTIETVKKVRRVLGATKAVFRGLEQDVQNALSVGREVILIGKDAAGIALTIADMPRNVTKAYQSSILNSADQVRNAFAAIGGSGSGGNAINQALRVADINSAIGTPGGFERAINNKSRDYQQNDPTVQKQNSVTNASASVNKIFDEPESNSDFFDALEVDIIQTDPETRSLVDQEIDRVRDLDVSYFIAQRDKLTASSAVMAAKLGVGNPTFNRIQGYELENADVPALKPYQMSLLSAINDLIMSVNTIIVQKRKADQAIQNYVDFYAEFARANGIDFESPAGKFAVPFPTGATLESLAAQYLGDSTRWIEIAALNGLKAPFVDEEGFTIDIVGPTNGNIAQVSDFERLYVTQPVILLDSTKIPLSAKINSIQVIDANKAYITFNKDVTGFNEATGAKIKSYAPNTVNDEMVIYIPSQEAPSVIAADAQLSPQLEDQSQLAYVGGVDLLLTSTGDFAMGSYGDIRLSYGLTNFTQAAKLKFVTPHGSLISYRWYGIGVKVGENTADVNLSEVQSALRQSFAQDPRFSSVLASRILKKGPAMRIDAVIGIAGLDQTLPISGILKT